MKDAFWAPRLPVSPSSLHPPADYVNVCQDLAALILMAVVTKTDVH